MKTRFLLVPLFVCLLAASFLVAAQLPGHVAAQASPLPGPASPLPGPAHQDDEPAAINAEGNSYVLMPYGIGGGSLALRIRTRQIGVGWWDACGNLHVELNKNGYADIPAVAQEISIPHDVLGKFDLEGWKKTQNSSGEWVLRRTTPTCTCTGGQAVCQ